MEAVRRHLALNQWMLSTGLAVFEIEEDFALFDLVTVRVNRPSVRVWNRPSYHRSSA